MTNKRILISAATVNTIALITIIYIILLTNIKTAAILSLALFAFCGLSSGVNIKAIEYLKEKQNSGH